MSVFPFSSRRRGRVVGILHGSPPRILLVLCSLVRWLGVLARPSSQRPTAFLHGRHRLSRLRHPRDCGQLLHTLLSVSGTLCTFLFGMSFCHTQDCHGSFQRRQFCPANGLAVRGCRPSGALFFRLLLFVLSAFDCSGPRMFSFIRNPWKSPLGLPREHKLIHRTKPPPPPLPVFSTMYSDVFA